MLLINVILHNKSIRSSYSHRPSKQIDNAQMTISLNSVKVDILNVDELTSALNHWGDMYPKSPRVLQPWLCGYSSVRTISWGHPLHADVAFAAWSERAAGRQHRIHYGCKACWEMGDAVLERSGTLKEL